MGFITTVFVFRTAEKPLGEGIVVKGGVKTRSLGRSEQRDGRINRMTPLVQEIFFGPQMYGDLYAYRLRDGKLVRLTHNKWEDGAPFWVGPASL